MNRSKKQCVENMLLLLPRDVLAYILSILVYDKWIESYGVEGINIAAHTFAEKAGYFYYPYDASRMGTFVRHLSFIHPLIREILQKASNCEDKGVWGFHKHFFHTLSRK